ncbi:S9 family peptidase [Portibacter lacus]|uniref:Peptidase S9 n=1 Tax=Portibacter lacus TaxID=1099794 RepID=A0AA37WFD1_9BACT|nr:prolyl oligopeptidase family serine peptidase [Portibacter lacus]GLR18703.1 peptidase S9 [Portibacter lacus]
MKLQFTLLAILLTLSISAQNLSTLNLQEIMKGNEFIGEQPSNPYWDINSQDIYFYWNPNNELMSSLYKTDINGRDTVKVSEEEQMDLISPYYSYNKDRTAILYSKDGDLFTYDLATKIKTQITNTLDSESSPQFSADGSKIYYNFQNNAYAWDSKNGSITQLTDFKTGSERKDKKLNDQEQWLEDDQLEHFEILKYEEKVSDARKASRELQSPNRPKTIYLEGKNVSQITVNPNGKYVTYRLTKNANPTGTKVPDFVTTSGYVEDLRSRVKVGSPENSYDFGIYNIEKDTFHIIDTKDFPGIYDKPEYLKNYVEKDSAFNDQFKKPRAVIINGPVYNSDGSKAVVVARSMDNKDRWIMSLDLESAALSLIDHQRDQAWIGGPGIESWNFTTGNMGWLADGVTLWFQSEETGYSHLYSYNTATKKKKQLTKGKFEILDASLSNDKRHFYFTSNEVGPAEQHFYKMKVEGGKRTKITSMPGNNDVSLSPDEKNIVLRYSYSNKPWELYTMPNQAGAEAKRITKSTSEAFDNYQWRDPELVTFKAADGTSVPARLYKPKGVSNGKPAVIFVHGAGYLQNVHSWWSSYYREYMFHNLLADNGYTVLDIDYRGSAGYGRDWRTAIYRHMGGKDLSDQVDGAKYLVEKLGVDKDKIGIYGGSYGGFISIFAMFNHNDVFNSGAALRSVTDWAHYNHGYTSNILNTPVMDPEAYKKSSPIYFADNFNAGNLVMLHGMVDRNVQFQDVVRLSQRLIELGKKNWDVAIFPMEGHGFQHASSWADEYRRIFELFEENLKN